MDAMPTKQTAACAICRRVRLVTRGWCSACYTRMRRSGTLPPWEPPTASISLTPRQQSILTGLMLGDGSLTRRTRGGSELRVTHSTRDLAYSEWVRDEYREPFSPRLSISDHVDKRTGRTYGRAAVSTRVFACFGPERDRWYPDGAKIVPRDLRLDALALAVWFGDDGSCSSRRDDRSRQGALVWQLATHSFTLPDVEYLRDELARVHDISMSITHLRPKDQYVLRGGDESVRRLAEVIEEDLPQAMARKALWRTPVGTLAPRDPANSRKTHCPSGHPYNDENTYFPPTGGRQCILCRKAHSEKDDSLGRRLAALAREREAARVWGRENGWPVTDDDRLPYGMRKAYRESLSA
jgi:hypothetical protein